MKRVLFYCQHLLGVGHLTRSLALCEALAGPFAVDFLQGGPDVGLGLARPRFRKVQLPPLLMREDDSSLYDPDGRLAAEQVLARRRRALAAAVRGRRYRHLIVELFPFGRRKFRHEIVWLIETLRRRNPGLSVHCSLRDIMIEREPEREAETVACLRRHFDTVLVHADPRFVRLEETFGPAADISSMLVYTGFVARRPPRPRADARRRGILVSLGGGLVGGRLAEAAVAAAARLPGHEFRVVLGPHTPGALRARLAAQARRRPNVRLVGFIKDFPRALGGAGLSVSLAGYNTVMDLLSTRTRGVVLPYDANREQALRARLFQKAGLLATATDADLSPGRLAALLRRELARPYPDVAVDLSGAARTRDHLRSLG